MTEPPDLLSNLPAGLKEKIADGLDYDSKMSLRQVTKDFKEAVVNSEFFYERLELLWDYNRKSMKITLKFNDQSMKSLRFQGFRNGFIVTNKAEKWDKSVRGSGFNYIDGAMEHLWKILKHKNQSKIHINMFQVRLLTNYVFDEGFPGEVARLQAKLKMDPSIKDSQKLSVKRIFWTMDTDPNSYLNLLLCLKPGVLERMSIGVATRFTSRRVPPEVSVIDWTEIARTEQWKQLKSFETIGCFLGAACLGSFHHVETHYGLKNIELDDIKRNVQNFFSHPERRKMRIQCDNYQVGDIAHQFAEFSPLVEQGNNGNENEPMRRAILRHGQDECQIIFDNGGIHFLRDFVVE